MRALQVLPLICNIQSRMCLKRKAFQKALRLCNGEIISAKVTDYHQRRHEPQTDGGAAIQEAAPRTEQKTLQCGHQTLGKQWVHPEDSPEHVHTFCYCADYAVEGVECVQVGTCAFAK